MSIIFLLFSDNFLATGTTKEMFRDIKLKVAPDDCSFSRSGTKKASYSDSPFSQLLFLGIHFPLKNYFPFKKTS